MDAARVFRKLGGVMLAVGIHLLGCGSQNGGVAALSPDFAPNGIRIFYLTSTRPNVQFRLKIADYSNGKIATRFEEAPFSDPWFAVTSDGNSIAFNGVVWNPETQTEYQSLSLLRAPSFELERLTLSSTSTVFTPITWSSDGTRLMLYGTLPESVKNQAPKIPLDWDATPDVDGLFLYDVLTKELTLFHRKGTRRVGVDEESQWLTDPRWSPDGKNIAAFRWTQQWTYVTRQPAPGAKIDFIIFDLQTGKIKNVTEGLDLTPSVGFNSIAWAPDGSFVAAELGRKIYTTTPQGDSLLRITDPERVSDVGPQVTPDGSFVTVSSEPRPHCGLTRISLTNRTREFLELGEPGEECGVGLHRWISQDEVVFVSQKLGGEPIGMQVRLHNFSSNTTHTLLDEPGASILALRAVRLPDAE